MSLTYGEYFVMWLAKSRDKKKSRDRDEGFAYNYLDVWFISK